MNVAFLINNEPSYLSSAKRPTDFYGTLIQDQVTKQRGYVPPTATTVETSYGVIQGKPWKHLWKLPVGDSVKVFLWEVSRRSLLTRHRLRDKPRERRLCGCTYEEETLQHLFLECERIEPLVQYFIHTQNQHLQTTTQKSDFNWEAWKNLYRVNIAAQTDGALALYGMKDEDITQLAQVQWSYLLWSVWLERNRETFDGGPWDVQHCIAIYSHLMSREIRSKFKPHWGEVMPSWREADYTNQGDHDRGLFLGIEWMYVQSIQLKAYPHGRTTDRNHDEDA
ncbi:Dynein light chain [Mucor velutinosus]|uniref:Dynein light chain n=1 Tax=Mucor velutinosus TaxID=708070 RepID=A0AAN7HNG0_9FUNG|nr:Dynein light chain [Mucor velutinosus]